MQCELDLRPDAYESGNFHPVYVGEIYDGHYRVYRKLGFGSFSTVWLVRDIANDRFFAMKVLSAECHVVEGKSCEIEVLERLRTADPRHEGYNHVLQLHDSFERVGPNGRHKCLILPVMGESMATFGSKFMDLPGAPPELVRRFAKQLLHALDYAHCQGIVHTDIKQDNMMIKLKDDSVIADWYLPATEDFVKAQEPKPPHHAKELSFMFWPNSNRVEPWDMPDVPLAEFYMGKNPSLDQVFDLDIVLSDWSAATFADNHLDENPSPVILRAPELLIYAPWNEKIDIWALGAIMFELLESQRMFFGTLTDECGEYYADFWHMHEMVDLFGPFPRKLLDLGFPGMVETYFTEKGTLVSGVPLERPPFEQWTQVLKGRAKNDWNHMLRNMFKIDPDERSSAKQLLSEPFVNRPINKMGAVGEYDSTERLSMGSSSLETEDGPRDSIQRTVNDHKLRPSLFLRDQKAAPEQQVVEDIKDSGICLDYGSTHGDQQESASPGLYLRDVVENQPDNEIVAVNDPDQANDDSFTNNDGPEEQLEIRVTDAINIKEETISSASFTAPVTTPLVMVEKNVAFQPDGIGYIFDGPDDDVEDNNTVRKLLVSSAGLGITLEDSLHHEASDVESEPVDVNLDELLYVDRGLQKGQPKNLEGEEDEDEDEDEKDDFICPPIPGQYPKCDIVEDTAEGMIVHAVTKDGIKLVAATSWWGLKKVKELATSA